MGLEGNGPEATALGDSHLQVITFRGQWALGTEHLAIAIEAPCREGKG